MGIMSVFYFSFVFCQALQLVVGVRYVAGRPKFKKVHSQGFLREYNLWQS